MIMADVMDVCIWQQIGGQALDAKRRHKQCALQVPVEGVGCATRKYSLPSAREIWPGGYSGGGEVCRCLGGILIWPAVVLAALSVRKIPADLDVFDEKEYLYKKKDAL